MSGNLTVESAPVILGSTLLRADEARQRLRPGDASSGCAAIDVAALDGGYRYGEVTCLSGAANTKKKLIAYHAIASHLLVHPDSESAYIDTNGSSSPALMRDVFVYRLRAQSQQALYKHSGYMYEKARDNSSTTTETELAEAANGMLNRVKIMRVFDFTGLVEAIGEIGERNAGQEKAKGVQTPVKTTSRRREIEDSEDESLSEEVSVSGVDDQNRPDSRSNANRIGAIAIASITNIISSTVSKSPVQGQALLSSFMRSLQYLTAHYQICTIVINAAIGLNPSSNPEHRPRSADENVSIFASSLGRPALGLSFTHMVDVIIYLSSIPSTMTDAAAAYGHRSHAWQETLILEVVRDKRGAREGRWAAFEVDSSVKLVARFY